MNQSTTLSDLLTAIEAAVARGLTGANVETATDKDGQYITRESAQALGEFIGTDVMDAVVSANWWAEFRRRSGA